MNNPEESSRFRYFCRLSRLYSESLKYFICIPCRRKVELCDPQQVLRSKFGDDLEVLNFETKPLVKIGDNFGSTIVKVSVHVKRQDTIENWHLVAKMLPSSGFLRKLYECDFTVAKEIFFYEQGIPAYEELYGAKLDIVPKFYGGRLSIQPDERGFIDENAVLLLENLKENGYVMADRVEGLSMEHMKHIIPAIAKFHAIGLAMKIRNPEFYSKMQKYTKPLGMPDELMGVIVPEILRLVKNNSQLKKYHERVQRLRQVKSGERFNCLMQIELEPEDPWACLVHRDLWINNVMFHMGLESQITGLKLFDFQNYCLSSPMTDLIYFLFTSMDRNFRDFDQVVEFYRTSVQEILLELECDASIFEKESFDRRLKRDAQSEIFHSIMIAQAVEMRSVWDFVKINDNLIYRIRRIFEIFEEKDWFSDNGHFS